MNSRFCLPARLLLFYIIQYLRFLVHHCWSHTLYLHFVWWLFYQWFNEIVSICQLKLGEFGKYHHKDHLSCKLRKCFYHSMTFGDNAYMSSSHDHIIWAYGVFYIWASLWWNPLNLKFLFLVSIYLLHSYSHSFLFCFLKQ